MAASVFVGGGVLFLQVKKSVAKQIADPAARIIF